MMQAPFDLDALNLLMEEIHRRDRVAAAIQELLDRGELPQHIVDFLPTWTQRERHHLAQLQSACERLFDGRIASA